MRINQENTMTNFLPMEQRPMTGQHKVLLKTLSKVVLVGMFTDGEISIYAFGIDRYLIRDEPRFFKGWMRIPQ